VYVALPLLSLFGGDSFVYATVTFLFSFEVLFFSPWKGKEAVFLHLREEDEGSGEWRIGGVM